MSELRELRDVREHLDRIEAAMTRLRNERNERAHAQLQDEPLDPTLAALLRNLAAKLQAVADALLQAVDARQALVPNAETRAAMAELERGEGKAFATLDELFADLHSDAEC